MAKILIAVENPLDTSLGPPLLIGTFVSVDIHSSKTLTATKLPRQALREGAKVFVMNDADELEIRTVEIAWRQPDFVLVSKGLEPGEAIVTSAISAPLPGMKLRDQAAKVDDEGDNE